MNIPNQISDYNHPLVIETAERLCNGRENAVEKLEAFFYFVRDEIKFGFPPDGDFVRASDVIKSGVGQCNNKSALLNALCMAAGIKSRIHFSLIKREIQAGLFGGLFYRKMPERLSHSWVEVELNSKWIRIDSFINDIDFYNSALEKLKREGRTTGYSVSFESGKSSADFNITEESFVQMDAVTDDHGTWDDPTGYYNSGMYKNRPGALKEIIYRLYIGKVNKRVEIIRHA